VGLVGTLAEDESMTRVTPSHAAQRSPRLTHGQRVARGKAVRKEVPRSSHAGFAAPPDRADPLILLEAQGRTRVPELLPIRYGRMTSSAFAFFRGAALPMASDPAHTPRSGLAAQACGSPSFDEAVREFAAAHADQNERDHRSLLESIRSGRTKADVGV
jgi:hypothetical protein